MWSYSTNKPKTCFSHLFAQIFPPLPFPQIGTPRDPKALTETTNLSFSLFLSLSHKPMPSLTNHHYRSSHKSHLTVAHTSLLAQVFLSLSLSKFLHLRWNQAFYNLIWVNIKLLLYVLIFFFDGILSEIYVGKELI